jgi:hypothetical protein
VKIHSVEVDKGKTFVKLSYEEGELDQFLYDLEAARKAVSGSDLAARLWRYWKKVHAVLWLNE